MEATTEASGLWSTSPEKDVSKDQRTARADPEDFGALYATIARRARLEGQRVWLEPLTSVELWSSHRQEHRFLTSQEVGGRLGEGWEFVGMHSWSCGCVTRRLAGDWRSEAWKFMGNGCNGEEMFERTFVNQLAMFEHTKSGIQFSLVPGDDKPWLRNQGMGLPGSYCCQRVAGEFCWEHTPDNLKPIRPLLVARWPMTRGQWYSGAFVSPPSEEVIGRRDIPLGGRPYVLVKSALENSGMVLPTPEEWRHLAAGGSPASYPWGDDVNDEMVWYSETSVACPHDCRVGWRQDGEAIQPSPCSEHRGDVMSHPPVVHDRRGCWNAYGLVDVIGNMWEWLADGGIAGDSYASQIEDMNRSRVIGSRFIPNEDKARNYGVRPVVPVPGWE